MFTTVCDVVFDLDGTLVDSKDGILRCLRQTLVRHGLPWQEPLDWFVGPPAHASMPLLLPDTAPAERDEIVQEYRELYAVDGWQQAAPYAGIREMLQTLHNDYRLFVCTAKRRDFAELILDRVGLSSFFLAVYADTTEQPSENKAELLHRLVQEQRVERAVMVGDRRFDLVAGRECGLKTIAVSYGYGQIDELELCFPDAICQSPEEVTERIRHFAL